MAQNFLACDREQELLLPPSLREWLPEDHLAWCAIGERSSRRIERRCHDDVAVRVVTANQAPDHTTIARFRQRHERPLGELFGDVLELCAEAGLGTSR
jgi:hypothetical protein